MKVVCYAISKRMQHQIESCEKLANGFKKHGIKTEIVIGYGNNHNADLIVCWGLRRAQEYMRQGKDVLIMERAYFEDRFEWISLGYNGLNGNAEFYNQNSPSDRWKKHFNDGRMKDWSSGDHVLLTTQVNGDMSIKHLKVDYQDIINKIRQNTDLPIYVRKHPLRPNDWRNLQGIKIADSTIPISEAAQHAKVVVTINSNSGVDAILGGTPVINIDKGSMVWDLAMQNDFTQINNPPWPDRMQWAYNTAYCQWLPSEIENGDAWDHLKQKYT